MKTFIILTAIIAVLAVSVTAPKPNKKVADDDVEKMKKFLSSADILNFNPIEIAQKIANQEENQEEMLELIKSMLQNTKNKEAKGFFQEILNVAQGKPPSKKYRQVLQKLSSFDNPLNSMARNAHATFHRNTGSALKSGGRISDDIHDGVKDIHKLARQATGFLDFIPGKTQLDDFASDFIDTSKYVNGNLWDGAANTYKTAGRGLNQKAKTLKQQKPKPKVVMDEDAEDEEEEDEK